jgi:hypothetical protein
VTRTIRRLLAVLGATAALTAVVAAPASANYDARHRVSDGAVISYRAGCSYDVFFDWDDQNGFVADLHSITIRNNGAAVTGALDIWDNIGNEFGRNISPANQIAPGTQRTYVIDKFFRFPIGYEAHLSNGAIAGPLCTSHDTILFVP